jgi:hypothetical protein
MSSPDRSSSLVSINSPFFKVTHNISVEVDYQGLNRCYPALITSLPYYHSLLGIFLNGAMFMDEMDLSSHREKRGLRIFSSPKLEISCALPASLILTVPTIKIKSNPSDDIEETEEESANPPPSGDSSPPPRPPRDVSTSDEIVDDNYVPYEWVGDTHGEIHEAFKDFIESLPRTATSFRICFACSDRMIRDTLTLTCRSLSCFDSQVGARERLISLPWYSADGLRHTAKVQSLTGQVNSHCASVDLCVLGNDLSNRLKTLEEENAALKRQHIEFNLQLMEHEQNQLMGHHSPLFFPPFTLFPSSFKLINRPANIK